MQPNQMKTEPPPFQRTVCACAKCIACCRRQPGPLVPSDIDPIRKVLAEVEPLESLESYLVASRGSLMMDTRTGVKGWIGSITPKMVGDRCVFLDQKDRCRIHAVSPAGCRFFDTHQSYAEGQRRGIWMALAMQDPDYQALRERLPVNERQNDNARTTG